MKYSVCVLVLPFWCGLNGLKYFRLKKSMVCRGGVRTLPGRFFGCCQEFFLRKIEVIRRVSG